MPSSDGAVLPARRIGPAPWFDVATVAFPIWVSLLFGLALYAPAPGVSAAALAGLFILREAHFGATWLCLFSRQHRAWLRARPQTGLLAPAVVCASVALVFELKGREAAFFLTNLASAYHVTRQSIGICKLYAPRDEPRLVRGVAVALFAVTGLFLAVGYWRFVAESSFPSSAIPSLSAAGGALCLLLTLILYWTDNRRAAPANFHLCALSGMLMYYPYCFVRLAEHANLVGLAMHWAQYLGLTLPLYLRRARDSKGPGPDVQSAYLALYVGAILALRAVSQGGASPIGDLATIAVLCSYNLHFYYEAYFWRFSDPFVRREIGSYVWAGSIARRGSSSASIMR